MISIHAPPRGATAPTFGQAPFELFQFTPLREGRRNRKAHKYTQSISIHAPPRGATVTRLMLQSAKTFQFTPLREGRPDISLRFSFPHATFQFTPLREGRQHRLATSLVRLYFNSRPSARGDMPGTGEPTARKISIHAPPRGATERMRLRRGWGDISIHAPPRGATSAAQNQSGCSHFNSRPSARGDAYKQPRKYVSLHFNSRPSARGDWVRKIKTIDDPISIHAPPRGATTAPGRNSGTENFNSRPSARGDVFSTC